MGEIEKEIKKRGRLELEIEHYKEALNQAIIDELQDAREEFIHLSNPIDIRYDICA